jgi:uroporphyrinogen decarboxylase
MAGIRRILMNNKQRVLNSINHVEVDRTPMMYRALPEVHSRLLKHFKLQDDIYKNWQDLMESMGFDLFSGGNGIGKFTKFKPSYTGPLKINPIDNNFFFTFGIDSYFDEKANSINYYTNKEFAKLTSIDEMKKYSFPDPDDFDYNWYNPPVGIKDRHFLGTGTLNSIFIIALYLRGAEQLMIELLANKKLAKYYINRIGEFVFEFTKKIFEKNHMLLEFYALWDDMAMQQGLMISYNSFKEFFSPWYEKIFRLAKEYDLITYFHICGNANEIISDLIDIGVDILDPVQVSARGMQLDKLRRKFGQNICFHGGVDVQNLLPLKKPEDVRQYIEWAKNLFGNRGGIILGPSHDITTDTPLENILAIYN